MKTKHYLYTVCWEPKSTVLFVHVIQCCYYLFSVQSVDRLLLLMMLKPRHERGTLYLTNCTAGLAVWVAIILNEEFVSKRTFEEQLGPKQRRALCRTRRRWRLSGGHAWIRRWSLHTMLKLKSETIALTWALSKVLHWSRPARMADFFPPKAKACNPVFNFSIWSTGASMTKRYELPGLKTSADLYIIVEMPLDIGRYFFIFPFEHALESSPAFKKAKQSPVVLVDGCDMK